VKKIVLFFSFIFLSQFASATQLDLEPGTWSLGGRFAVPYKYDRIGRQTLSFHEEPEVSFFVTDSIRLVASLEFQMTLRWSRVYPATVGRLTWGGKFGAEYLFDTGIGLYPYTGAKLGVRIQNIMFDRAQTLVEVPLGILWAMNEHVALNFAMPVEISFTKFFNFEDVSIAPGYFGAIAFF